MSLSSEKTTIKNSLRDGLKAAFMQSYTEDSGTWEANLTRLCERLATEITNNMFTWINNAKKPVVTVTTAPSGTWTAEAEPTSGSGIEVGG